MTKKHDEAELEAEVEPEDEEFFAEVDEEPAPEPEPEPEPEPQPSPDDDDIARRAKVATDAPYHAEGFNVYDGRGNRVVICGTDNNRAASGPGLALSVADALNRTARGRA